MGGFEGSDHINSHGRPLDLVGDSGHRRHLRQDYQRLAQFGIRTIRESIGCRVTDGVAGGMLDDVRRTADAAEEAGLQVIWTLHHYGLPAGLNLFDPNLAAYFSDFCDRIARVLRGRSDGPTLYQPINEISFLSWAAGTTHLMHPYKGGEAERGYELKCLLVRAALRGCDALWATEPDARMVHTDPLIHIIASPDAGDAQTAADWQQQAATLTEQQYQAWDMLSGRIEPGLGGSPRYLDVIGLNYYHGNQWEHPDGRRLPWHLGDPRRRDLADMLQDVWTRYQRPFFIAETGHVGDGRGPWLDHVAQAALRCAARGVPLEGICLYPVVGRPDWEEPEAWHRSGLWDVAPPRAAASPTGDEEPEHLARVLHAPLAQRLMYWTRFLHGSAAPPPAPLTPHSPFPHSSRSSMTTLIVFSHLRWDFVFQRPQQLLSRLAERFDIVFVEEPMPGAQMPALERLMPCNGVEVLRPHLTGGAHGFHDDHIPQLQAMLAEYLTSRSIDDYWLWFYTPMATPLAADLQPSGVIYDCMDELAAFRNAPRQLLQRENALFKIADLVFTGGHSLFEAKRARHEHVYCFPSSVDAAHYARAADGLADDSAQAHIPHPRIGYFGVIDERVDLELIAAIADANAQWQVVMVGPVVKIDAASLPKRANIHWLGQREYADLPDLIAGWDVCMLPFALNESTRYISPTKTLEYLAAGKPVVSTPIRDVVTPYGDLGAVSIASSNAEFVAACAQALERSTQEEARHAGLRQSILAGTSWDGTAERMAGLIESVSASRPRQAQPASVVERPYAMPARAAKGSASGFDDRPPASAVA
jgi:UDP-galactopyranose mutase